MKREMRWSLYCMIPITKDHESKWKKASKEHVEKQERMQAPVAQNRKTPAICEWNDGRGCGRYAVIFPVIAGVCAIAPRAS